MIIVNIESSLLSIFICMFARVCSIKITYDEIKLVRGKIQKAPFEIRI